MSRPIVVGLALREDDAAPLALARMLARIAGAPLALTSVYPLDALTPVATVDYAKALQERARTELDTVAAGLRPEYEVTTHVSQGSRAGAIQELADRLDAVAAVVGSSHHGTVGRVLSGDVASGLLHGAPCPVAVAPRDYTERPIERIGVAYTASEEGRAAAETGFGLARRLGASVLLLSVVVPSVYSSAYAAPGWVPPAPVDTDVYDRHLLGAAERAIADLGDGVRATAEVRRGPVVATLAEASASLDLLVCGSRGYGAVHSTLAGGVSRGLAHTAACPLLLVPRRTSPEAAALWRGRETVGAS
jgi:nucleotide-binding universal stress UspA family protein